ncbi:MAG: hypothetical protein K6F99_00980 [Lachnospiraceae bacterium]|nr:hypothetical protein [Lachnospiraceae bacterium]
MNNFTQILLYLILLMVLSIIITFIAGLIGVPAGCRLYIKDTCPNGENDSAGKFLSSLILIVRLLTPIGLLILIAALRESYNTGMVLTLFLSSIFTILILFTTVANATEKAVFSVPNAVWDTGLSTGASKNKVMKTMVLPNIKMTICSELIKLMPISLFLLFVASLVVQNRMGELITTALTEHDYPPLLLTIVLFFIYNYICGKLSDKYKSGDQV